MNNNLFSTFQPIHETLPVALHPFFCLAFSCSSRCCVFYTHCRCCTSNINLFSDGLGAAVLCDVGEKISILSIIVVREE